MPTYRSRSPPRPRSTMIVSPSTTRTTTAISVGPSGASPVLEVTTGPRGDAVTGALSPPIVPQLASHAATEARSRSRVTVRIGPTVPWRAASP